MEPHRQGTPPEQGATDEDSPHQQSAGIHNIQTGTHVSKQDDLAVCENMYPEDAADTQDHEFDLPALVARGVTEGPFQIRQDQYGTENPGEIPEIT